MFILRNHFGLLENCLYCFFQEKRIVWTLLPPLAPLAGTFEPFDQVCQACSHAEDERDDFGPDWNI